MACLASHYLLWQECLQLREPILILEDDIHLMDGFGEAAKLAREVVGDDVVRLCGLYPQPAVVLDEPQDGYRLVQFLRGPEGTQAYAIAPGGAERLVAQARPVRDPADAYMDRFWQHGVRNLASCPGGSNLELHRPVSRAPQRRPGSPSFASSWAG